MVTRAQLTQAAALGALLDKLQAASDALAGGGTVVGVVIDTGNGSQFSMDLNLPTNAVQTFLTNRIANIQTQLTALGIT